MDNMAAFPVPMVNAGQFSFPWNSNFKVLSGRASVNQYTGLRENFSSSAYQVTAGKKFKILSVSVFSSDGGTTVVSGLIGYADTDAGWDSAAAPTNPVTYGKGSASGGSQFTFAGYPNDAASKEIAPSLVYYPVMADVPASKYLYMWSSNNTAWIQVIGYEYTP